MDWSRYIIVNALFTQGIHNYISNNSNENNNKQNANAKDAATYKYIWIPSALKIGLQTRIFFS